MEELSDCVAPAPASRWRAAAVRKYGDVPAQAVQLCPPLRKPPRSSFLGTKMRILSRQAKDNHRGNVKISLYCRRHHSSIVSTRIDASLSGGLIVVARAAEMER
jgi:hypothetical protein